MSKKVKSIRRFNQNYKNFSFSDLTNRADEEYLELTLLFDENGNTLEEVKFMKDGEIEEKNSYEYNTGGKLSSHTLLYAVDDVTEKRMLNRNEKGLLVDEVKYYGNDSGERTNYEYNDKDNITAIIRYDEEGEFISREEIIYDDKGSLNERKTIDANNKLISRIAFITITNEEIEEIEYNEKDTIVSKTVIKFNDKGKETSVLQKNPQGKVISSIINSYDENDNIIEKINKDFYSKRVRYEYNDKNLLTCQEIYDENGMLLRKNMYDYDEEGNLIAEQTYEMDTTRGGRDKHFGTRYEYEFY
jgi:hypothetical protein